MTKHLDGEQGGLTILGALAQLKQEIQALQDDGIQRKELPMFVIEGGELELKLVAKRERKLDGKLGSKLKLYVFSVDGSASESHQTAQEAIQTLKIRFSGVGAATAASRGAEHLTSRPIELGNSPPPRGPVIQTDTSPTGATSRKFGFDSGDPT